MSTQNPEDNEDNNKQDVTRRVGPLTHGERKILREGRDAAAGSSHFYTVRNDTKNRVAHLPDELGEDLRVLAVNHPGAITEHDVLDRLEDTISDIRETLNEQE